MAGIIHCRSCGQRLEVPEGYSRAKLRCECGVFNDVPTAAAGAKPRPAAKPAPTIDEPSLSELFQSEPPDKIVPSTAIQQKIQPAPPAQAKPATALDAAADLAPLEREVLIHGTTDENDYNPYKVLGDAPTRKCPECQKTMDLRAKVCVRCGFNLDSGAKAERTYEPIDITWENGWPFQKRILVYVILQMINFLLVVASIVTHQAMGLSVTAVVLTVGLQAFVVGTYDRLHLTRSSKGKVVLTRTWRYAFFERPTETIRWKEHVGVSIVNVHETDMMDWVVCVILFGYLIVPGVLFLRYAVLPEKLDVALCKEYGTPETVICRTTNEARAKEIMKKISDVTTLPVMLG